MRCCRCSLLRILLTVFCRRSCLRLPPLDDGIAISPLRDRRLFDVGELREVGFEVGISLLLDGALVKGESRAWQGRGGQETAQLSCFRGYGP